jgi:hypothetical protein
LVKEGKIIKILESNEKQFMFAVAFHDGSTEKKILEEYIILMPVSVWKTYLPNLNGKLPQITEMYNELLNYKLKGNRTDESEKAWQDYMYNYNLCFFV